MISNFKDFNKELHDYVSGKFNLTPIQNILMNDYDNEWYSLIGKYFLEKWGEENLQEHKITLDRIKKGNKRDKETGYRMLGIFFITSHLNEETLKEMFGKPICHSEFGEGFDNKRKYDDRGNESPEYCSYFLNIDGHKAHIGYDHRGTSIEVENGLKPEEVFNMIKELVDRFSGIFDGPLSN